MAQQFSAEDHAKYIQQVSEHYEEYLRADVKSDDEIIAQIQAEELTIEYADIFERQNRLMKFIVRKLPDFPVNAQADMIHETDTNILHINAPYILAIENGQQSLIDTSEYEEVKTLYLGLKPMSFVDSSNPDFIPYRGICIQGMFYIPEVHKDNGCVNSFDRKFGLMPLGISTIIHSSYKSN